MVALKINPRFKELCRTLTEEEFSQLETNIVNLGRVREEILVWKNQIIDGHNRHSIATAKGIPFDTSEIDFTDENAACNWIIHNQLGRRNLSPADSSYLRGKLYISERADETKNLQKGPISPNAQNEQSGDSTTSTADRIAAETGVSAATVRRDAAKAAELDSLPDWFREGFRNGKFKATAKAIKKAAGMDLKADCKEWRDVRAHGKSLDEALGLKNGKKPDAATKPRKPAKGKPTNDVRKFAEFETYIGRAAKMNTDIKVHVGGGIDHHEKIRQHLNSILGEIKEWKHESGAA